MKIAHIVPASIKFPPNKPNGRYMWVLNLARLQSERGNDVTIFAKEGSTDNSKIKWRSIPHEVDDRKTNNINITKMALKDASFDIFHSHFDNLHYKVGHLTDTPIVFTQHWWPIEETLKLARSYEGANIWAVPPTKHMLSFNQENGVKSCHFIHHGVDLSFFHQTDIQKNGRLLTVGRISPEKNLELCIEISKKANIGLDIVGKITPKNQTYWEKLLPMIDGIKIVYHGTKSQQELLDYYSAAQAVLFPSNVHEAFGLVAIEAQACGTPVIMTRGGSRGELIDEGHTGFLCESIDEYAKSVHNSAAVNPQDCYAFAKKFDMQLMVDNYQHLYSQLTKFN